MSWCGASGLGWQQLAVFMLAAAAGCGGGSEGGADNGALGNDMIDARGNGGGGGASTGGGGASGGGGNAPGDGANDGGPPRPATLTVDAVNNSIVLDRCAGLAPAMAVDVPAGDHTIALTASTLSKGSVPDGNEGQLPSFDDYVIVHLPIAPGEAASRRFFMLNGVGATATFELSAPGAVQLMFIDSDAAYNDGRATVTLDAAGPSTIVDGLANVLAWKDGCASTPAAVTVSGRPHRATLVDSTLSAGGGSKDDVVLLRLPSERPMDPSRFVILNGVGASVDFTPHLGDSLRGWFITPTIGASGRATIAVTDQ